MSGRVCVGVIVGAQGVQGAVRLKSFTADPSAIGDYGPVEDGQGRRFRLKVQGMAKGLVTARLEGVRDRDAAEALKGTELFVPRAALPATEDEEEFYYADLIGLRVELAEGGLYGTVKAVFDFGAGDVLEVQRAEGPSVYLPFTKAVFPVVDVSAGRLLVVLPDETEAKPEGGAEVEEGGEDE